MHAIPINIPTTTPGTSELPLQRHPLDGEVGDPIWASLPQSPPQAEWPGQIFRRCVCLLKTGMCAELLRLLHAITDVQSKSVQVRRRLAEQASGVRWIFQRFAIALPLKIVEDLNRRRDAPQRSMAMYTKAWDCGLFTQTVTCPGRSSNVRQHHAC